MIATIATAIAMVVLALIIAVIGGAVGAAIMINSIKRLSTRHHGEHARETSRS